MLASASVCVHPCARPGALQIPAGHWSPFIQTMQQLDLGFRSFVASPGLLGNPWPPWTPGHSGHGPMHRCPRYRAATGARGPLPFGHTTANLASGGVSSTARFMHRDQRVKTGRHQRPVQVHGPRQAPAWLMVVPGPSRADRHSRLAASRVGGHNPRPARR